MTILLILCKKRTGLRSCLHVWSFRSDIHSQYKGSALWTTLKPLIKIVKSCLLVMTTVGLLVLVVAARYIMFLCGSRRIMVKKNFEENLHETET